MSRTPISVCVGNYLTDSEDYAAVILGVGGRVGLSMSIAEARQLSVDLARAADEADLKVAQLKVAQQARQSA